jgi:alpha-L-rhamnosidase
MIGRRRFVQMSAAGMTMAFSPRLPWPIAAAAAPQHADEGDAMTDPNQYAWISPGLPGDKPVADRPESRRRRPTWWMRQVVTVSDRPESFIIEVVCLGYYELYVNGERAGDEPLAPSISKLDRRGFAIRHDVSKLLREGNNCIAIWCSSGWYLPHQFKVHADATPLIGLRTLSEGKPIDQPPTPWLCRPANRAITGPWKWNNFGGEWVDARAALPQWNQPDCDTTDWRPCRAVTAPKIEVSDRTCPPNRIGEVYPAKAVRKLGDRHYEVDFGTCLSGWVDLKFGPLPAGRALTMRFYDLPADNDRKKDHSYRQYSVYHAAGDGADRFTNKFNYAGFRYVTIKGIDQPPELKDMRAMLVECAMDPVGSFDCSNKLYNQIHQMNVQTLRCLDLGGYSVDCPHRERNGYGADGQTALPAYLYLLNSQSFLHKWLIDWCDVYEPDTGRISHCAPTFHRGHSPAWGGIAAPLAWSLYVHFGDRKALEIAQPVILGYCRFIQAAVREGVLRQEALGGNFHADWVPPRRGMDSRNKPDQPMRELFNSCYLIYLWEIFIKVCHALDRTNDIPEAQQHIADLRQGIHREFYDAEAGLYLMPEQAYQAMPLLTGVVPTDLRPAVHQKLIDLIKQRDWHVDTGLPGTTLLLDYLMQRDEHQVIANIYNTTTYPGWGYMVAQGATTIWEQWNGFWSQIHSCFAGPAAWFYTGLAGIRPDPSHPGFKSFILAPAFVTTVDAIEASYDSARGRIESRWQRQGDRLTWHITIPDHSKARIHLPMADPAALAINSQPFTGPIEQATNARGEPEQRFTLNAGRHALQWNT